MKKMSLVLFLVLPAALFAQLGIKAGLNYANISKVSALDNSRRSGFHFGIFLAPASKGIISSRTEVIFSRQGYNYSTSTNTGNVNLDYIMLPQFMAINISKYVQLQLGGQMAFLLNAKADSAKSAGPAGASGIMSLYNRFDYGYGGGVEIHPVAGLIIGARINISLNNLYKNIGSEVSGTNPSFVPAVNVKNNVVMFFAGWKFGGSGRQKKQQAE